MYASQESEPETPGAKGQITNLPEESKTQHKSVRWKDENTNQEDEWCTDSDSGEDEDEEEGEWEEDVEGDEDDEKEVERPAVIQFRHSEHIGVLILCYKTVNILASFKARIF